MIDNSDFPVYSNYDSIDQVDRVMNYVDNKILDLLGLIAGKLDIVDRGVTLTLGSIMKSIGNKAKKDLSANSRKIARLTKKLQEVLPYEGELLNPEQAVIEGITASSPNDISDIGIDSFLQPIPNNPYIPDPEPPNNEPVDPGTNPPYQPPGNKPNPNPEPPTKPPVEPPVNPPVNPFDPPLSPNDPLYPMCGYLGLPPLGGLPYVFPAYQTGTNIAGKIQAQTELYLPSSTGEWLYKAFTNRACLDYTAETSTFHKGIEFLDGFAPQQKSVPWVVNVPYQRNNIENISPWTDEGENILQETYNKDSLYQLTATYASYNEMIENYNISSTFSSEPYRYQTLRNNIGNYV